MNYYPRLIEPVIFKAASMFRVIAITGARQTGKSTLLRHVFGKTHRYVSLDDPRYLKLAQEDPHLFFEQFPAPIIIDEIQYAPELLSFIKMKVDEKPKKGMYILTGSQRFTMMKGLQETLAGRVGLFELYPMAIGEGKLSTRRYDFRVLVGSYPELIITSKPDADRWYASYLSTYIEKDVQPHYQLEKVTHFRNFIFLLAARNGQSLNYDSLSRDLGVSVSAIKLWTRILEISQIIYLLKPYYINLGSRVTKSPKVYFTDAGLVSYLTGCREKKSLFQGAQAGTFFENFVIQETIKHYLNQGVSPPLYYMRTNNGLEIDLIVENRVGVITPCEIKLTNSPHVGMAKHISRLRDIVGTKIQIKPGFIICQSKDVFSLTRTEKAVDLENFLGSL